MGSVCLLEVEKRVFYSFPLILEGERDTWVVSDKRCIRLGGSVGK
jgi:hypothetical protein